MRSFAKLLCVLPALAAGCLALSLTADAGAKLNPVGMPAGFTTGLSERYAVWYDAKDGYWRVRTTTAKTLHRFHGKVTVHGGTITEVASYHLEEKGKCEDQWKASQAGVVFDFKTDRGIDGIRFKTSKNAKTVQFDLHIDGKSQPTRIFVGAGGQHPATDDLNFRAHP